MKNLLIQKLPHCSAIVLNFKGLEHLYDCLSSIRRQTYPYYDTYVLDYGGDGSQEFIKKNFPDVKIIYCPRDNGSAGGFNFAVRHIDSDYLLFFANDIELEPDVFEKLMMTLLSRSDIGMCCAKMLNFFHREIIDYAGFRLDIFGFPCLIGVNEKDTGKYDQIRETIPTGTALSVKRAVFNATGGFDDNFFTLADELDLSWRARLLGFKTLINPFAVVYHKSSARLRKKKRWKLRYYSEKNTIRMLLKNYGNFSLIFIMPFYFYLLFCEFILYVIIWRTDMAYAIIKAIKWNIVNYASTLKLRKFIQKKRKIGDREIFKERIFTSFKMKMFFEFVTGKYKI